MLEVVQYVMNLHTRNTLGVYYVQILPGLRNFRLTQFLKKKPTEILTLFAARIFACGTERVMRVRWRKNTAGRWHRQRGGHAAADQVPVCWSLDFNWAPVYTLV